MAEAELFSMYPAKLIADLANSGLEPGDIRAKPMGPAEKAATGTPTGVDGYAIPYFTLDGKPLPFYRVKLFDRDQVKYLQVADQPNHIYFPPKFWKLVNDLKASGKLRAVLWTEGEKKAAKCVKEGIPCVAVGGVDSWRSRTLAVPKEATIAQKASGGMSIRLPAGKGISEGMDVIAKGMQDFVDFMVKAKVPIIICYDTDAPQSNQFAKYSFGMSVEVQRAAATLGFELRHRGVPITQIRQLILPAVNEDKTGLDDYLIDQGPGNLLKLIEGVLAKRSAFPKHPNTRDYVNKQLQKGNISRREQMGLSLAVLSDLDARGQRLRSPDAGALYYFNFQDKSLTPVTFTGKPDFAETPFGRQLYRDYNLGTNDMRTLQWLSTQFSAEEPIMDVYPEKLLAWRKNTLYYHINDGLVARVSKDRIDLIDNGEDGVLFEAGLVEGIKHDEFEQALKSIGAQPIENWWESVLANTRIRESNDDSASTHRKLLSLLYYVSPFFYRWSGTQLPVEITWGEAGSGKSTLFELRLAILTGIPKLRNSPSDLKDWNASLAASGGLHVTDNVQMNNVDLRNRLSDEICRLVTEPSPSIEQRKLYSDTALVRIPVRVVFGITAIKQPFTNVDIIQRAVITEMDKGTDAELKYDAQWKEHQLASRGGRATWLAHHLLFVQRMLQLMGTETGWNPRYQAKYRLINVEQLLQVAARVVGEDGKWIPGHLEASRDRRAQESDWTLEGLSAWADMMRQKYPEHYPRSEFSLVKIAEWAEQEEEFKGCQVLVSSRLLKRYIDAHKHTVATVTNIVEYRRTPQGAVMFHVRDPAKATTK